MKKIKTKNLVWMSWKDIKNPLAGGAEQTTDSYLKMLSAKKFNITLITSNYRGGKSEEFLNGYKIIRVGNRYTVYIKAFLYFKKKLEQKADIVVDECNTIPFFVKFYTKKKVFLLIQQQALEVWFYQMIFPISIIGYFLENFYLKLLKNLTTFTFAKSTKKDLKLLGFKKIYILKEDCKLKFNKKISQIKKFKNPTILFFSNLRPMKRFHHVLNAFEICKKNIGNLKLLVAGGGNGIYFKYVQKRIKESKYTKDIKYLGKIQKISEKINIFSRCHYIVCTSVREGWGIIVSEAGICGTPAIVYKINGLKDAVNQGRSGIISNPNILDLSIKINNAIKVIEKNRYKDLQTKTIEFSKKTNVKETFNLLYRILNK